MDEQFALRRLPIDLLLSRLSRSGELSIACTMPFFTKSKWDARSTIHPSQPVSSIGRRVIEASLYADRDIAALQHRLDELERASPASLTADLIARAYRYRIWRS